MLKNYILVSANNIVKKGQPIAQIGNSRRITQPHLHMLVIAWTDTREIIHGGYRIPIYFDGKLPTRNNIIKKQ